MAYLMHMIALLGSLLIAGLARPALAQIENGIPPNELNAGYIMEAEREVLRNMQRLNAQTRREPPTVALANAQAAITRASIDCQVTEAQQRGRAGDGASIYETVCREGTGYLVVASQTPQVVNCLVAARAAGLEPPSPDETTFVCVLRANQNGTDQLVAYAREAGIRCEIDSAAPVGTSNGQTVYEIGCRGQDGYRIKRIGQGWEKTECWIIVSAGSRCGFTTPEEQFMTMKARLAGTEAASCDVDGGRFMGANANGAFYEARCAGTDGYIFHVKDDVTDRVIPCAIAAPIGGGCTLSPSRTSASASPPRR